MSDCVLQFQHLSLSMTKVGSLLDLCLLQNNNSVCREKVELIIATIREGQRSGGGLLLLLLVCRNHAASWSLFIRRP